MSGNPVATNIAPSRPEERLGDDPINAGHRGFGSPGLQVADAISARLRQPPQAGLAGSNRHVSKDARGTSHDRGRRRPSLTIWPWLPLAFAAPNVQPSSERSTQSRI